MSSLERRVLNAIEAARKHVVHYAAGSRLTSRQLEILRKGIGLEVHTADLSKPSILMPPFSGEYRLVLDTGLSKQAVKYLTLHEIGHILAGDAEELTVLQFQGPLPEAEPVADLFALSGMIGVMDCLAGVDWVENQIRKVAPINDRGWQEHRIERLAPKVVELRRKLDRGVSF